MYPQTSWLFKYITSLPPSDLIISINPRTSCLGSSFCKQIVHKSKTIECSKFQFWIEFCKYFDSLCILRSTWYLWLWSNDVLGPWSHKLVLVNSYQYWFLYQCETHYLFIQVYFSFMILFKPSAGGVCTDPLLAKSAGIYRGCTHKLLDFSNTSHLY